MNKTPHITRRRALLAGAGLATTSLLPWPVLGDVVDPKPADALDATAVGGIDLYIDRHRISVGSKVSDAILINGQLPGPTIRMTEGRTAEIRVHNRMGESTSIHWHGLLVPFDMDGVPGVSFGGIDAGTTFTYRFDVRQHGTYWYHSHTGLQEQLGHYGLLVLEPANGDDSVVADVEHGVVLGDWTRRDPHVLLDKLKTFEAYYNYQRPTLANLPQQARQSGKSIPQALLDRWRWQQMRMDPTDLLDVTGAEYDYLINGKTAAENPHMPASPGQRVRLRMCNASAMTYHDLRVEGPGGTVPVTVVAADGQRVEPVEVDELRIAVAETYDVVFVAPDGPATLWSETMDRSGFARATISAAPGESGPIPDRRVRAMLTMADMGMAGDMEGMDMGGHGDMEMGMDVPALSTTDLPQSRKHGPDTHGPGSVVGGMMAIRRFADPGAGLGEDGRRVLTYSDLRTAVSHPDRRAPDREFDLHVTGNMAKYIWGFDGKTWSQAEMIPFVYGERLRINFINDTMMSHPLHLHGMWMDLYAGGSDYARWPRKHTVNVKPSELVTVDVSVDAPGHWAFHCHLLYHMEVGMFRTVAVVRSLDEWEARHG